VKRLLLAGGGHAHIEVLRRFARVRPGNTELLLVTPSPHLIYTGMLPGLIAGHYALSECLIDLSLLAARTGATFIRGSIGAMNAAASTVMLRDGRQFQYDVLSLNVGAVPMAESIPGAKAFAIPVRPMEGLLRWWTGWLKHPDVRRRRIGLVGAGAGGVELALAMHHRLMARNGEAHAPFVLTDAADILVDHHPRARTLVAGILEARGIEVHTQARVARLTAGQAHCADGRDFRFDVLLWVTGVAAPAWICASGLGVDEHGFVAVHDTLQSTSHESVFAVGDAATMVNHPRPKAGVYAVRQGPPLAENLRRALQGERLRTFRPQRHALALIGTGDSCAVASRDFFVSSGRWVWLWKQWIDRRFVARYRE
jgi:selenide,water dikinase